MQKVTRTKLVSLFVLAFLCLNAGGALCLTYCTQAMAAAEKQADHCPLKKKAGVHCPSMGGESAETNNDSIEVSEASCCMMPVSLFAAAPVENRVEAPAVMLAATVAVEHTVAAPVLGIFRETQAIPYRPPPNDRRGERILHHVFRI